MAEVKAKFLELTRMKYVDQAKWFLNGFWTSGAEQEAENIWKYTNKFIELDPNKKEGNELDEFWSHKFLESLGETLTVIKLREKLRQIDVDANGKMALLEYLLFKYNKTVPETVNSPQGDNREEIEAAENSVREAQAAYEEVQQKLAEQKSALEAQRHAEEEARQALESQRQAEELARQALENQRQAEEVARQALESQKAAENEVRKAEAELKAAVDDLKAQEDAYQQKCAELEAKSKDPNAGTVAKSKAANELAQLKQENPLPLRKAKITQEAALRKVEKQRAEAEARTREAEAKADDATAKTQEAEAKAADAEARTREAEQKAQEAEERTREAEESTRQVEAAVRDAEEKFQAANALLEEVKQKSGTAFGAIWWMERELKEAQKYLPKSKQRQP